jgi:hypothetical protein
LSCRFIYMRTFSVDVKWLSLSKFSMFSWKVLTCYFNWNLTVTCWYFIWNLWLSIDTMVRLLPCAVEHLNAEIVQLTVSDITLAIEWLKCSYLYIRIKKAWTYYSWSLNLFGLNAWSNLRQYKLPESWALWN